MRTIDLVAAVLLVVPAAALAQQQPSERPATEQGQASYFNGGQNGHTRAANGEPVRPDQNTAASRNLPLGTRATVTDKATGKSTEVKVNDRGPVRHDRVIDVSKKAAGDLGMKKSGTAPVVVHADPNRQTDPAVRQQLLQQSGRSSPDR